MHFELTSEQEALVAAVASLTRARFGAPTSRAQIPVGVPHAYLAELASAGFAGVALPESDGGQGGTLLDSVLVIEAAARVNPVAGDAVQALNFGAIQQLARAGSPWIKNEFLRPCLSGTALTAIAMTEPQAGSAVSELVTLAVVDGSNVVLTGSKIFTTHGADADFFVVWVRFGADRDSIGAIVVRRDTPGLHVDASHAFISGEHYGMLFFDDCVVPAPQVLVARDGFRSMLSVFNIERLGNATRSLALGQRAFDLAVEHLATREQFGRPLIEQQGLRWRLAEMALKLESARLLLYRAAFRAQGGVPNESQTAMAKLACNRAGFEVCDAALQMFGGAGFDGDSMVSYLFHRTRGWLIAGGTVEQMLDRIGRGLRPRRPSAVTGGTR